MLKIFTLKEKKKLTEDVFLLSYEKEGDSFLPLCGQFMTFLLEKSGGKAYSILHSDGKNFDFIVKRLENGRGGSKEMCDAPIGKKHRVVGPAGHFILKETDKNKLFLGTGTGVVPLYFQSLWILKKWLHCQSKIIFWLREEKDIFLLNELQELKNKNNTFDFEIFLSREENTKYNTGRITNFLTPENIKNFEEFYICWNPAMIESVEEKLFEMGIKKEQIFTEKY